MKKCFLLKFSAPTSKITRPQKQAKLNILKNSAKTLSLHKKTQMTIDERLANTSFPLPAIREVNQAKHATGISLGLGELKSFKVDNKIIDALKESLTNGGTSYTANAGLPELRQAIANNLNTTHQFQYSLNNVVITIGVQNAIYCTIKTLAKLGAKRVLIPEIYFGIYNKIPFEFGLKVETYALTNNFGIDIDKLAQQINDDDILLINSPANPTGRVLLNSELSQLATLLNSKLSKGYVISDEIYSQLVYSGEKPNSFLNYFNRTIVVDGISKSAAAAGLRVGWVITQNQNLANAITSNNSTIISAPPTANQYAAIPVVTNQTTASIQDYNQQLAFNCEHVCKILSQLQIPYIKPTGSFYIFPNLSKYLGNNSKDFCIETAKAKNGVVVIPGVAFGSPKHIRISLATHQIEEGMRRLVKFLKL